MSGFSPSRRHVSLGILTSSSLVAASAGCAGIDRAKSRNALADLETRFGGKLGAAILNTRTGESISHRGDERFGMCSSFKLALASVILRQADENKLSLETFVPISQADMVYFAPVVTKNLRAGGMTIAAMAEAAQVFSDNVATNKLLDLLGGPAGFTAQLRAIGDAVTRLDRKEPEMMQVPIGDPRDTTSPLAMARTCRKILTTNYLTEASRATLIGWMEKTTTGSKRIRAGLPTDWRSGDKTGTGLAPGTPDRYNDIAITWPGAGPHAGVPFIITAFYESPVKSEDMRDIDQSVLAEVGRVAARFAASDRH
ncbi:MAG: class A beta-lactamase [Caulobacterales bacterium]